MGFGLRWGALVSRRGVSPLVTSADWRPDAAPFACPFSSLPLSSTSADFSKDRRKNKLPICAGRLRGRADGKVSKPVVRRGCC